MRGRIPAPALAAGLFAMVVLGGIASFPAAGSGQGTLYIETKDPHDQPIAGAAVRVVKGGLGVASGTTNPAGQFLAALDPGDYDVVVSKSGYRTETWRASIEDGVNKSRTITLAADPESGIGSGFYTFLAVLVAVVVIGAVGAIFKHLRRKEQETRERMKREAEKEKLGELSGEKAGEKAPSGTVGGDEDAKIDILEAPPKKS